MFPKQITPFILIHPMPSVEVIQSKLEAMCITPITGLDWFSEGFAPPTPFSNDLTFTTQNATSGSLKRSERVLPNSVIKAAVDERVAQRSRIEYVHEDFGDVQTIWKDGKKYEYRYTHWFPLPQNPKASE